MTAPKYLMWFTRFGQPHFETQYDIEDCYDLKHMLDNADTATFDQYGILNYVEHIGRGVIPREEWDAGLEAYAKQAAEETQEQAEESPPVAGWIVIAPPEGRALMETYRSYRDEDDMQKDFWWLRQALGDSRVALIRPRKGTE